jgi:methylglutaconyl-CoA hydratase
MKKDLIFSINDDMAVICLNRPEKGNALNLDMIRKLNEILLECEQDARLRFIMMEAKGPNFCAGADLIWMLNAAKLSDEENRQECIELAALFENINKSSKIFIAKITGGCYGGGVGLVAVCDFAFATDKSEFSFGEVRLGLVPAIIAPYIIYRIGFQWAKMLMLTGDKITSGQAHALKLIDYVSAESEIENRVQKHLALLRRGGPNAQMSIKKLLHGSILNDQLPEINSLTAEITATMRVSEEGQEGILAFLEKRNPKWQS